MPTTCPQNKRKAFIELTKDDNNKKPKLGVNFRLPKQAVHLPAVKLGFAKTAIGSSISADEVLDRNIALGAHKKTATQPGKQTNNHNRGGIQKGNDAKKKKNYYRKRKSNQKKV